jgi:ubiquinone/menaquinone biosynthesis C-methylase UbiE
MTETTSFFTDGEAYERMMGRWSRVAGEAFLDWLAQPPDLRWLDVGCGTGAFTQLLLDRCAPKTVNAIDPAEAQLAFARARFPTGLVSFQLGDAQSLPYAAGEFDAAAMALVITFIPDPEKAAHQMRRVVTPGGMIGTYVWDFMGRRFTQEPLRSAIEAMGVEVPPMPGHINSTIESLRRLFAGAGLDRIETRTIDIEVTYPSFSDYWSSQTALASTTVQHVRKMSASQLERLKAYLQEHLPMDRAGRVAYPARANAVKGRVPG